MSQPAPLKVSLPASMEASVNETLNDWKTKGKIARLWEHDATLWTDQGEEKWLGWLTIASHELNRISEIEAFAAEVKARGYKQVLLLGMGGSSLCPEVLRMTFGVIPGFPELHILDSTDPAQVASVAIACPPESTLYIVASKSGGTLEPNIFKQYFFDLTEKAHGKGKAGDRFVAVTDPGSNMEKVAKADGFWKIFYGEPTVGGRYSALSAFGTTAMAAMGLDVRDFLERTLALTAACKNPDLTGNPGGHLGAVLGTLGKAGRDKVTLFMTPSLWDMGAWMEQLIAESTGKLGRGIIPVDLEKITTPDGYGSDRLFVYVTLEGEDDAEQAGKIEALEAAGHPIIRITLADRHDLGAEFFRWEFAIAVAGAILGINPFDQPDVEASKIVTKKLTSEFEKTKALPSETAIATDCTLSLFTDEKNGAALKELAAGDSSIPALLKAHFSRIQPGDYAAVLAYIPMTPAHQKVLQEIRHLLRDRKKVATCLGFGPRFLHSTGQAYKGGPNTGVFLQITCDDDKDLPVPGQTYTFGVVKAAQARGDFEVLAERNRRALRVHLPANVDSGLETLLQVLKGVV